MTNPHKGRTGLVRLAYATRHSVFGLRDAWRHESAFRQECVAAAVMLPASAWIGRNWIEMSLLAGTVLLVLVVELLNSAIETVVDRVSYELHDLSRRAKDIGSAAVLIALLMCVATWLAAIAARLWP